MKRRNIPRIIKACHLSFKGATDREVGKQLNLSGPTISKWRQLPVWKETEAKLIEKTIEQEINQETGKESN